MLAEDEVTIKLGSDVAVLRPTLRAALRLERQFCGFDKLIEEILEENATAMATVIRECSDNPTDIPRIIEEIAGMPFYKGMESLKPVLVNHVLRLAGRGDQSEDDKQTDTKRITFAEHHTRLYSIATGWLGWTPEVAWTSTASEITEAFKGRIDMLKSIYGGAEEEEPDEQSAEQFNSRLSAVLAMSTARFNAASGA